MNKIRKSIRILREKGLGVFLSKLINYSKTRLHYLCVRMNSGEAISSLKNFQSSNPSEVFDFIASNFLDIFEPMQVREEFVKLLEVFRENNPKYIMEVGTANGGTLFCISKLAPSDATVVSIDLPGGRFGGGYPQWKTKFYKSFAKSGQKLHLLRADSHKEETLERTQEILDGHKLDFLFIDGDHTYEGVKKDFEMYSPLVREEGIIAFHDIAIHPVESECFVHDLWVEICQKDKSLSIIKDEEQGWAGIGVLFK